MGDQAIDHFKGQPRLLKFAAPKRYDLKLKPDLSSCTFTGILEIDLQITSPTRFLVLNAAGLSVDDSSVAFTSRQSNKVHRPKEVVLLAEDEILGLQFNESLPVEVGVLSIAFSGTLNDQMKGFYGSTYEHNGEKKNMAVTQFESRCTPMLSLLG